MESVMALVVDRPSWAIALFDACEEKETGPFVYAREEDPNVWLGFVWIQ